MSVIIRPKEERAAFAVWIAEHYDTGDIVPGSGGCRKVRWSRKGKGKRRFTCDLLQHAGRWNNLVVADLRQKQTREHSRNLLKAIKEEILCP